MNYKAPDNSIHVIEPEYAHLLPVGSIAITDEEAEALRLAAIVPPSTFDLLAKLDADNTLTQRNLREFILLTAEAVKMATNGAVDMSQVVGVANVAVVEAEAAYLRSQL